MCPELIQHLKTMVTREEWMEDADCRRVRDSIKLAKKDWRQEKEEKDADFVVEEEEDRGRSDELDEEAEENEVEILDEPERGRRAPKTRQSGGRGRSTRRRGGPRSSNIRGRGRGKKNN